MIEEPICVSALDKHFLSFLYQIKILAAVSNAKARLFFTWNENMPRNVTCKELSALLTHIL